MLGALPTQALGPSGQIWGWAGILEDAGQVQQGCGEPWRQDGFYPPSAWQWRGLSPSNGLDPLQLYSAQTSPWHLHCPVRKLVSCHAAESRGFLWPRMRADRSTSCPWCWLPDLLGPSSSSVLHARVSWHGLQEKNLHSPANHIPVLASLAMPQAGEAMPQDWLGGSRGVLSPCIDHLIPTWEYPKGHLIPAWQSPKGHPCFTPFLAQMVRVGRNYLRQLYWFICEASGSCSASRHHASHREHQLLQIPHPLHG